MLVFLNLMPKRKHRSPARGEYTYVVYTYNNIFFSFFFQKKGTTVESDAARAFVRP